MISNTTTCGWIAFDIEERTTKDGKSYIRNSINVPRNYKVDGKQVSDTINFVAYGQNADYLIHYAKKGDFLILSGRLQSSNYTIMEAIDIDGQWQPKEKKIYSLELNVEDCTIRTGRNMDTEKTKKEETPAKTPQEKYEELRVTPLEDPNLFFPEEYGL